MGGILRALDVAMFDDRRLCAQSCSASMIGMDVVTNDDMYRVDKDLCSDRDVADLSCFTRIHANSTCRLESKTEPPLIAAKWDLSVDAGYFGQS